MAAAEEGAREAEQPLPWEMRWGGRPARDAFRATFAEFAPLRVVVKAGTHTHWI